MYKSKFMIKMDFSSSSCFRCGLIGLGHHGIRYATHLQDSEVNGTLLAICRRDSVKGERFATEHEVSYYQDYNELIDDPRVEVIIVVVPPELHLEICSLALRKGKPVLVEKPLADSLDSARKIVLEAEKSGTPIMVAQTLRFDPVIRELKKMMGNIGSISMIKISQHFGKAAAKWVDKENSYGTLLITGVHGFDLVRNLTNQNIEQVSCFSTKCMTHHSDDTFVAILRLSGSLPLVCIENTRASGGRSERVEVVGTKAQLIADVTERKIILLEGPNREIVEIQNDAPAVRECLNVFFQVLRNGGEFPVTIQDALQAVAVAEACHQSSQRGDLIRVDTL